MLEVEKKKETRAMASVYWTTVSNAFVIFACNVGFVFHNELVSVFVFAC